MSDNMNFTREELIFQDNGLPQFSVRMPDHTVWTPNGTIYISEYDKDTANGADVNIFAHAHYKGEQLIAFRDINMWQQHHLFGYLEATYSGQDKYLGYIYLVEKMIKQHFLLFHRSQIVKLIWFTLIEYNNFFKE